jgi:class 3 adenylate cyclase
MKQYAFVAKTSHKKELQIRQIFQKYAPKEQIDEVFGAPGTALAGDKREIAVLFADIRGFTAVAEKTAPQEAIDALNRYFSLLAETVNRRNGMIDKFIGEALRAFWGAPVKREDDPMQAVLAGLDLLDTIKKFNDRQRIKGKPEFNSGIGISYGSVIVGNIGSGQKMEYTVLGDTASLAAQLGGLTGVYKEALLISESLYTEIKNKEPKLPIRLLDTAAAAGKAEGVKVYAVKRAVSVPEAKAWGYYHEGMSLYYRRSFEEAVQQFRKALVILHEDRSAEMLIARSLAYEEHPPPPEWNGAGG